MTIKCKNMTHAMKAKKLLTNSGFSCSVKKINNDPSVSGCIYSIIFNDSDYDEVISILQSGGVILHKSEKNRYGDLGV